MEKLTVDSVLAPFLNQPSVHTDTHDVTLRDGRVVAINDSHFGVPNDNKTYNMITDARLTTEEVIERVLRSNLELKNPENAELAGEIIARIEELRAPQEYTGPVEHFVYGIRK